MSMLKKILLSSNQKTNFLSTTINSYLQDENFEVLFSGFNVNEVNKIKEMPKLILLNFENIEEKDKQFLSYIRDLCMEEEKWVYLCGQENEVKSVAAILPKGAVTDVCTRPFDIPEMIKKMNIEIEQYLQAEGKQNIPGAGEPAINLNIPKQILLLSNKTNFLSMKIKSNLQQESFDVLFSDFDIDKVSKLNERPNLILLNFEGIEEKDKQFLYYVRDLCIEEEKRVFLCGHENDIKDVVSILPKGAVEGTFKRPFNITELITRMNREMDKYRQDQGRKHILVVDDSGEMLRAIRNWLSGTYRVSVVNSGANAILFLANQKPDLILLDYEMPFCSGPQMMEMIRAESTTSAIPVMFLTGKSDKESLTKVLSLKPEGYMLKSTSPEKIKETIGKFFIEQKAKEYNKG